MRYAIASTANTAAATCNNYFARSEYFAIFDTNDGSLEFIENKFRTLPENVGQTTLKHLSSLGVNIVVSTEFGNKIKMIMSELNIGMVIVHSNKIKIEQIIKIIKSGIN